MPTAPDHDAWRSYDSVVDAYARVRAERNAALARDLVAAVAPPFTGTVLDVGAGTGVAADVAIVATGTSGVVVAVDPSTAMLREERHAGVLRAAAEAPGLPFADTTFDRVVANLVIAHVSEYATVLADMVRVLLPNGRLGVSAWGALGEGPPVDDEQDRAAHAAWTAAASEFASADDLDEVAAAGTPWDDFFDDPANLRLALDGAGLRHLEVSGRAYRYRLSLDDWLTGQDTTYRSRYLRHVLGEDGWTQFRERARKLLAEAVPDPVNCVDEALFAVGTKPGGTRRDRP
ncbi:MAG: methyltransferase domain-containing protein [Acidimicrobiia bacterium]